MSEPHVWDDAAIEVLKRLRAEGFTAGEISKELISQGYAFTRNAVIGKTHRLELPPPPPEAFQEKLRVQRKKTQGKIQMKRQLAEHKSVAPQLIWYHRPHPLGAQALAVVEPPGSHRVLLIEAEEGQCRAIVGYENGELSKAIICGDSTPIKMVKGRPVRKSWCQYHSELYTQEDRPRR